MAMRLAILLGMVGCWHAPPAPSAPPAAATCDPARWRELAATTRRAWLVSVDDPYAHRAGAQARGAWRAGEPVAVLAVDGADVEVATVRDELIAARWIAATGIGHAAMATTAVSRTPGGAPDPAVRILVGYRLPDTAQAWLPVRHAPFEHDGLELEGFVPAAIRGVMWDEPARPLPGAGVVHDSGVILDGPHAGARPLAKLTWNAQLEIRGEQPGFREVTARTRRAEVDGFLATPPPPPPPPPAPVNRRHVYDFSDDVIEGELVRPEPALPVDTCLYDAPGGEVVGMILGRQPGRLQPVTSAPGWSAIELQVTWGSVTYYAR